MYLTIQEVAERTGLSAYTIRYYEKSGVLPRVQRTESGIRRFTEVDMASLRFISDYKKAGMPLEEIKEIIEGITQYGCILPRVAQRADRFEIRGSPGCFPRTAPLLLASWASLQDRIRPLAQTLSGAV